MLLTTDKLKKIGAKYVFCLMQDLNLKNKLDISMIVPKYTIGWTDMEIKDAPSTAVISFCFFNGYNIERVNAQIIQLKVLEKL